MVKQVNLSSNIKAKHIIGESVLNLKYDQSLRDYFMMLLFIQITIIRIIYVLGRKIVY